MQTSSETDKIIPALIKARKAIKNPAMNSQGHHGNRYANIEAVMDAVTGPLLANDLFMSQDIQPAENAVRLVLRVYHASGQWVESSPIEMAVNGSNPFAVASAVTYCRRYQTCAFFSICGDPDDDGTTAEHDQPKWEKADALKAWENVSNSDEGRSLYNALPRNLQNDPDVKAAMEAARERCK